MSDTIDYIDDYFTGVLGESERGEFEARCSSDEAFASEVAFYVSARQTARNALLEQKKQEWQQTDDSVSMKFMKPVKKTGVSKWITYAAAACVIFIVAGYFLLFQPTPQRLAEKYISNISVGHTMDASHDSLQDGIEYFNNQKFDSALVMFNDLRERNTQNTDAQEYAGLSYLRLHKYDEALDCFRKLSSLTGLQSNPGDILQATTLLVRNQPGDERKAKSLLEKVLKEDEEGSREAKDILAHW